MKIAQQLEALSNSDLIYLQGLYTKFMRTKDLEQHGQVCLRYPSNKDQFVIDGNTDVTARDYGCGSLQRGQFKLSEKDFDSWSNSASPALVKIVDKIMSLQLSVSDTPLMVGRVRFMKLLPKTCLSYHRDPDPFRFHIPIIASEHAFFIVGGEIVNMAVAGGVYALETQKMHTAVNASFSQIRVHLVISTWVAKDDCK